MAVSRTHSEPAQPRGWATRLSLLLVLLCAVGFAVVVAAEPFSAQSPSSSSARPPTFAAAPAYAASLTAAAATAAPGAWDPTRSAYAPLRTAHPVPAADEVGAKATSLGYALPHPSTFIPPMPENVAVEAGKPVAASISASVSDAVSAASSSSLAAPSPVFSSSNSSAHPLSRQHESLELDTMRDNMMNSKWMADTKGSSGNSMRLLRNFPRKKADGSSGLNQLQRLGGPFNRSASNAAEEDPIADYIAGMFFMYGVPLFFAMLCIVCWAGFCIGRCACNLCGRHATVLYTDKQVRINYVLSVLLVVFMCICTAFGWTGNVQVSEGLDSCFNAADSLANYGYEFMGVASTAYAIGFDALLLVQSFNSTLATIPTAAALNVSLACVAGSTAALQEQYDFVSTMRETTMYFTDDASNGVAIEAGSTGVGQAAAAISDLASPVSPAPPGGVDGQSTLQNLQTQLQALNDSLAMMPSMETIEAAIGNLTYVQTLANMGSSTGTYSKLRDLNAVFVVLNDAASAVYPILQSSLSSQYATLEAAIGGMAGVVTDCLTLVPTQATNNAVLLNSTLSFVLQRLEGGDPSSDLPDVSSMRVAVESLRSHLVAINATVSQFDGLVDAYFALTSSWPLPSDAFYDQLRSNMEAIDAFQAANGEALQAVVATELPTLILALQNMRRNIPRALDSFAHTQNQISEINGNCDLDSAIANLNAFSASNAAAGGSGRGVICLLEVFQLFRDLNSSLVLVPDDITYAYDTMVPPLEAQSVNAAFVDGNITVAIDDFETAKDIAFNGNQPDYASIANMLTALNQSLAQTTVDFSPLWHELYQLSSTLTAVSGIDGVTATFAASGSDPSALWSDVLYVGATPLSTARGHWSAVQALTDLGTRVLMGAALGKLRTHASQLRTKLRSPYLTAEVLDAHVASLQAFETARAETPALIRAVLPVTSTPLPQDLMLPLDASMIALDAAIRQCPSISFMRTQLGDGGINATLGASSRADFTLIEQSLLGLQATFEALPTMPAALRALQSNATVAALPELQALLLSSPNSLAAVETILDDPDLSTLPDENAKVQRLTRAFSMSGMNTLYSSLDQPGMSLPSATVSNLTDVLAKLPSFQSAFPDLEERYSQGASGLEAIGGALDYMQEKKQSYQKAKEDFQSTMNNYDGVRLLVFNLGVLLPLVLSTFLLVAAVQHYGCPAMVAGLTFFPLFVLFMAMAAVQMPVSVALADHCYNTTGEIKIQTAGRSYQAEKLDFFKLSADIDIPSVVDYFTECKGSPPELLQKLQSPQQVLVTQGLDSAGIRSRVQSHISLPFAAPLLSDMNSLAKLEDDTLSLFDVAVGKLNCSRSSDLYHTALDAVCNDFAPPFALTTCVFLLTAFCMLPGICLGVTGYKRFDPLSRESSYARAPATSDDVHVMPEQQAPEGWN